MATTLKVLMLMGSDSDYPVLREAEAFLENLEVPFEVRVSPAHRSPGRTRGLVAEAEAAGVQVFICAAGMAAHLAGVVAGETTRPVIGVPVDASPLGGRDALLATVQMPAGIPVATVGINGARNAAILASQILATADEAIAEKVVDFKKDLKEKIVKANEELAAVQYKFKTN